MWAHTTAVQRADKTENLTVAWKANQRERTMAQMWVGKWVAESVLERVDEKVEYYADRMVGN